MNINVLCTIVIILLFFLIEKTSPESPRCERRLVCGSDGQVYESLCDFQRALLQDQSLGTLPLHECLGVIYVMPSEHSQALMNLTKQKSAVGTKIAKGVEKEHMKSGNSNAVLEVNVILSLQSRDNSVNFRTSPTGRGCPDTIYILPEEHFFSQRHVKSVVVPPTRKMFALLQWLPGNRIVSSIVGGVFNKLADFVNALVQKLNHERLCWTLFRLFGRRSIIIQKESGKRLDFNRFRALLKAANIVQPCFLIKNVSPESPRCERRLVCDSNGQVYEASCDFQLALRQDLGTLPLHECLGMMYMVIPEENFWAPGSSKSAPMSTRTNNRLNVSQKFVDIVKMITKKVIEGVEKDKLDKTGQVMKEDINIQVKQLVHEMECTR